MDVKCQFIQQNTNSTSNPQLPWLIVCLPIFLIYPLLCCSPPDGVTHGFHVESWSVLPAAHRSISNSLTFVMGLRQNPGDGAPGQMPLLYLYRRPLGEVRNGFICFLLNKHLSEELFIAESFRIQQQTVGKEKTSFLFRGVQRKKILLIKSKETEEIVIKFVTNLQNMTCNQLVPWSLLSCEAYQEMKAKV